MVIILDFDDVCVDFVRAFMEYQKKYYNVDISYENLLTYNFNELLGISRPELQERFNEFYNAKEFMNMKPIEGAIEGIAALSKIDELIVISYRDKSIHKITSNQAELLFPGKISKVICNGTWISGGISENKEIIAKKYNAIMAVDDGVHHVEGYATQDIPALLFTRPWNKHHKCEHKHIRVDSWKEIVEHAKKISKK